MAILGFKVNWLCSKGFGLGLNGNFLAFKEIGYEELFRIVLKMAIFCFKVNWLCSKGFGLGLNGNL